MNGDIQGKAVNDNNDITDDAVEVGVSIAAGGVLSKFIEDDGVSVLVDTVRCE
jgi:hypothetical protein